jgi:2-polyprenyl-3-methyl-5-hydroxy-6-metoxy-1,4-benzoquinol methylase
MCDDNVALFDARAAVWDANPQRRALSRSIASTMDAAGVFKDVRTALDFGCGTGLLTLELATRAEQVTGLDTSPAMLAELSAKISRAELSNVDTLLADLGAGDLLPATYDLVTSSMALHHVADVLPVLTRLFAAANRGGRLALADLDSEGGVFHDDNAGVHHFGFDRIDLADMLAGIGWTDIDAKTAATIDKPGKNGEIRPFTVFLMTARKP